MPRTAKPLTLDRIKKATAGMLADGNGLYLHVAASGAKSWIFRYTLNGRRRDHGIGSLRLYSLALARDKAIDLARGVRAGIDPISERRRDRAARQPIATATFGDLTLSYIEGQKVGWAVGTLKQWNSSVRRHVLSKIGKLPVADVDTDRVLEVLRPLWAKNANTGAAIRSRIELVLGLATAKGLRSGDNPARWSGHLEFYLASPSKAATVKHREALPFVEIPGFMRRLRAMDSSKAAVLEFAILTCARIGEALGVTWSEIDFGERLWIIPAERTKSRREHRVPLSMAAFAVLERQKRRNDTDYIFLGDRGKMMHSALIGQVLAAVQAGITVHGFRSSFRDWAAENGRDRDLAEMALGHVVGSHVERSHRRSDLLARRRELAEAWAAHCR